MAKRPHDPWSNPALLEQMQHGPGSREHLDGFKNELTGIGDWRRDKVYGGKNGGPDFILRLLTYPEIAARWRGSDLGKRIVETLPDEMTREGWDLAIQPSKKDPGDPDRLDAAGEVLGAQAARTATQQAPLGSMLAASQLPEIDNAGTEASEEVDNIMEELGVDDAFWHALAYTRGYGGGAILLGVDDGEDDLTKPLDFKRVREVKHLTAFQGGWDGEIIAWSYYRDPTQPNYGMPEMYMLRNLGVPIARVPAPGEKYVEPIINTSGSYGPLVFWVHASRFLIFPGDAVSHYARVQMRGWGDSVFTRVDEVLSGFNQTWGSIVNLLQDFSQGVLQIDGLAASLGANNRKPTANLATRATAIQMTRSIARMMLIDKNEKFSRETTTLTGLPEIMDQLTNRLAAACDMPVALLMGQRSGLNATGDADTRWFYDRVRAQQIKHMRPQRKQLTQLILQSRKGPTGGKLPAKWNIKPRSLFQPTEKEVADIRKTVAETDAIYVDRNILTANEVTVSRYGGSKWNMDTVIDVKGRQQLAELEAKQAALEAKKIHAVHVQPGVTTPGAPDKPAPTKPGEVPSEKK